MTPLRKKMIKAMELRNLSKNTQRYYLSAVIGIARYYQQSPDTLSQEMIEDYLLYLKNDKGNTPGTCATVVAGLRFFYNHVADRHIPFDYRVRKKTTKLPTVLTPEEIWHLINASKNLKHRLILMATYSGGLRAGEVAALKPRNPTCSLHPIRTERTRYSRTPRCATSMRRLEKKLALHRAAVSTPSGTALPPIFWRQATISVESRC